MALGEPQRRSSLRRPSAEAFLEDICLVIRHALCSSKSLCVEMNFRVPLMAEGMGQSSSLQPAIARSRSQLGGQRLVQLARFGGQFRG
jgi:hypothetical protein